MRRLIDDIARNQDSFDFARPVLHAEIEQVEAELAVLLPHAFTEVLEKFGQGTFFDAESLLGVHEIDDGCGDLVSVNGELREKQGLDAHLVVFHLGTGGLHAFDTRGEGPDYEVVELDEDSLEPGATYPGFDTWYQALREQYADFLGLDEAAPDDDPDQESSEDGDVPA